MCVTDDRPWSENITTNGLCWTTWAHWKQVLLWCDGQRLETRHRALETESSVCSVRFDAAAFETTIKDITVAPKTRLKAVKKETIVLVLFPFMNSRLHETATISNSEHFLPSTPVNCSE